MATDEALTLVVGRSRDREGGVAQELRLENGAGRLAWSDLRGVDSLAACRSDRECSVRLITTTRKPLCKSSAKRSPTLDVYSGDHQLAAVLECEGCEPRELLDAKVLLRRSSQEPAVLSDLCDGVAVDEQSVLFIAASEFRRL